MKSEFFNLDTYFFGSRFYEEHYSFFIMLGLCLLIASAIVIFAFIFSENKSNTIKYSAYECGFDPYSNSRIKFNIRFYLIALLFVVFDIEVIFFLPFASELSFFNSLGLNLFLDFFIELVVSMFVLWQVGAFDWDESGEFGSSDFNN
jgi:NADH-quinone oxidoreductase subunit A